MNPDKKKLGIGFCVLWLGLVFSFWDAFSYEYINFDDPDYLFGNPLAELSLFSGAFWEQLWTTSTVNLWHPITVLSHQVMLRVTSDWGMHHGLNVFLHGIVATLWGVFLYKVVKKPVPAIIASILYAWHPVTVESVAWLSGRKDLLCGIFIVLTFLFHLSWVNDKRRIYYASSLITGCIAMLCKPVAFLIPVILILLDLWPLQRLRKEILIKEKLPWIIPALLTIVLTLTFQSQGGQAIDDSRSIMMRGAGALWALKQAVASSVIPIDLYLGYSDPLVISPFRIIFISAVLITFLSLTLRGFKKAPYLLIGVLIFIVFLVPTLGLIRAGNHLAADRYCYLPLLGMSFIVAGILVDKKPPVIGLLCVVIFCFLILQKNQVSTWENLESISQHALKISPNNATANAQLALIYYDKADEKNTIKYLEKTLTISPEHAGANIMAATLAKSKKDWKTAEKHYRIAVKTRSNDALIWYNLAHSQIAQNKKSEGLEALKVARDNCKDQDLCISIDADMQILLEK